ncbi:MAG TPA: sigma-70 family RNA polymerase sigma factor [Gemmataceae bacterium]|jgi:RNA polymerase sigma factor (sigma-70 family)
MANASLAAALRQVCRWAAHCADYNLPDHQLLERFAAQRDEAAFTALVRRHGGLVLSVARRILRDAHAAEDIFQNTFLTLARRAGSIRKRESLASWLYGVAARLASQTRLRDTRRSVREREASPPPAAEDVTEAAAWRELGAVLDEELQRVPEKYRTPLVHIYFAGQTQEEAARQLGWSKGTLRRRLERGKRLLHDRLSRRGVSLSVGLLADGVSQSGVEAALPPLLVRQTIGEAMRIASTEAALSAVGVGSLSHAKMALVLGLLIAGGAGVALRMGGEPPKAKQEERAKPPAREAKRPRVDRFGDPLPPGAIARMGTMRLRHANGTTAAFAPDGKSLLTCGPDQTIRTWDAASGRLLREQRLPPDLLRHPVIAVFSSDSRLLVFEDLIPNFVLWDVEHNKLRHKFTLESSWPRLVFSPDGKMLVTAENDGTLRVWDTTTGKGRLLGRHDKRIDSLSFTADGTLMSLGDYKTIRFWDLIGGRERSRLTLSEPVPSAAVSPDGRVVAVTSHFDKNKSVRFWDAVAGKPVKGWKDWDGPTTRVPYVQFAPDGKTVLIGTQDSVIVWDPLAGKRVRTLLGQSADGFVFSSDGETVASFGHSTAAIGYIDSVVHVWNWKTGAPHTANSPDHGHLGQVDGIAISPNGRIVASSSRDGRGVRLWDATTGRLLRLLPAKEGITRQSLRFMPGGKELLLGAYPDIVRWEIATGREIRRYSPGKKGKANQDVTVVHLCDDGRTLLALSQCSNSKSGAKPPGNADYALHTWDLATGEQLRSVPLAVEELYINYSRFSPDGRLFAIPGGSIRDASTGEEVARLSVAGKALDAPVAFSPDGALFAMGVQDEVTRDGITGREVVAIQVWETATLSPAALLTTNEVAHVAFTSDGRRLVSAGLDALTLWDIASGRAVARRPAPGRFRGLYGPSFASSLAVATDGRTVATGNADTTILLWDLSPPVAQRPAAPLTTAQREACWTDLAGEDAGRAFTAIARLADAPEQTVPMLRDRLHAAKAPSAEELRRLLADLDHAQFERREKATKRLAELGELADTTLREALQRKPSLEIRRRIESLLAASRLVHTSEERRHLRAVRVLESIGTAEARQVLKTLSEGASDARRTKAAKDTLRRLTRQSRSASN